MRLAKQSFIGIFFIIIVAFLFLNLNVNDASAFTYGNRTLTPEEIKLSEEESELQGRLSSVTTEMHELQNNLRRTIEETRKLELLRRNVDIYSNALVQNRRQQDIEKSRANLDYYQNQLDAVERQIKNTDDSEKLLNLEKQKADLEEFVGYAQEAYDESKYQPVNWGAFGSEMLSGFVAGSFYDQYQGLAKIGSLLLSEKEMEKTSKALRRLFCDYLHLPTIQCLSSKVCARFPDSIKRDRTVITRTQTNQLMSTVHVEGTKSPPIPTVEDNRETIETLYTSTYAVYNALDTPLSYTIQLIGEESTYHWDSGEANVGETISRTKSSPLLDYLEKDYHDVCIAFTPSIEDYWDKTRTKLCSPLVLKG